MRNNEERIGAQKQIQADITPQVLQSNSLNLSFIAPTEIVDLPSKGMFYPEGHPLRNKTSVEIKQMTAKEEDILTNRSLLKKGVALEKLLESLVLEKEVNPSDLLICDRNAIFLSARISAYGQKYATTVICPTCQEKSKFSFDLLEELEKENEEVKKYELSENGTFKITLPSTGWNVECRALDGNDEKKLLNSVTSKSKEETSLIDQLKMFIVSIQNFTEPELIKKAIETMPASDSRFLRRQYELIVPSLDLRRTFVCKNCDSEEALEVPLTAEFFWPK